MTVYNGERYLKEAIESCLAQTYTNLELIIIDDGSTDNSLEIIKSFKDDRIELYINESNKGQSYSRNRGIKKSTGAYIAIIDADDVAYPDRIEKQMNYLINKDADLCFSWAVLIDSEGNITGSKKTTTNQNLLRARLLFECPFIHPTAFWRKAAFVQNNFWYDEYYTYAQDYELWTRVIKNLKFGVMEHYLLKYRFRNETSITFSKFEQQDFFQKTCSKREIKLLCGGEVDYMNIQGVRRIYSLFKQKHTVDEEVKQYFRDLTNVYFNKFPYRFKKIAQIIIIN